MNLDDTNRDKLLAVMTENGIKPEDLPAITGYSISSVKAWMMPDRSSDRARQVPDRALEMFTLKLEAAKAKILG